MSEKISAVEVAPMGMKFILGGAAGSFASAMAQIDVGQVISVMAVVIGVALKIADTLNQRRATKAAHDLRVKEDARAEELHKVQMQKAQRELDSTYPKDAHES